MPPAALRWRSRAQLPLEPEAPGVGRPTKFTPELADRLVWLVRHGCDLTAACADAGIGRATLYRWLNDSRRDFRDFAKALERAEASAEVAMTAALFRRGATDWRAALAWLRHRHPERWSR